jgi:hypothetical protein
MTQAETDSVTELLSKAGTMFNQVDANTLDGISEDPDLLIRVKRFINMKVTDGERITNTSKFVSDLMNYIYDYYQLEMDKLKTEAAKERKKARMKEVLSYFSKNDKAQIVKLFDLYNIVVDAKLSIITKLDKTKTIGTFLKTADGYKVTEQEGFVAIDKIGKAVKLVDRMNFSKANFSTDYIKGWQK